MILGKAQLHSVNNSMAYIDNTTVADLICPLLWPAAKRGPECIPEAVGGRKVTAKYTAFPSLT
jgi:hypothetical protein